MTKEHIAVDGAFRGWTATDIRRGFKRRRVKLDCSAATHGTPVEQAHKDEVDVNRIMAKYAKDRNADFFDNVKNGRYADLASVADFQTSMNVVAKANEAFAALPSDIREYFDNDPAKLLKFTADPRNTDLAIQLGLAKRPVKPKGDTPEGDKPSGAPPAADAAKPPAA